MHNQEETFKLRFDGEALRDHTIAVNDLAPSLLALGDLFNEANNIVTNGQAELSLRVKAGFEEGSFTINLDVILPTIERMALFFTSEEGKPILSIMALLGFLGLNVPGLIDLIKRSKGKKPKKVIQIEQSSKVRMEFEGMDSIEVDNAVAKIFNSLGARNAAKNFVRPLDNEGMETIEVFYKGNPTLKINQDDLKSFALPEEIENETISEAVQLYRILSPNFVEGRKWRVSDGVSSYTAEIADGDFLIKIERGETFGSRDYLRAKVITKQWIDNGKLKISRTIVKVIEHIKTKEQIEMHLPDKEE